MLWVDKGKEYYNKNVLDLLAKNDVKIYSTEMKKSHLFVRDGIELLKQKRISNLLYKTTLFTLTF